MADKIKRVTCLYRVSTKGQVDKDDIPMQKSACRNFIAQQKNWKLVKEYQEKGVSGYKKSLNQRDVLQQIKHDAETKLFDVLLVFMFDRLGRREDETPFVVEWFVKQGIEVWSVKEGQQTFEDHTDKLLNYLRFWQSSGESYKTSIRVDESHKQLTKLGIFRGGTPPYGYKLVPSGRYNKKGKELLTLAIDKYESEIVKTIFNLTYEKHWGGKKIAEYLNSKNVLTRYNNPWSGKTINSILANPIYKGYLVYGKRKRTSDDRWIVQNHSEWVYSNHIPEIEIIEESLWESVRKIKTIKKPIPIKKDNTSNIVINSSSPLLLTGIIRCGYCNSPLTTTYNTKTWTNKDGTVKKYKAAKYRCSGKALGRKECEGQTIYGKDKIENVVIEEVEKYLDKLSQIDLKKKINSMQDKKLKEDKKKLDKLQKENENNYEELAVLQEEVGKSIIGKSAFKPELLSKLISDKEEKIKDINKKILELEDNIKTYNYEISSAETLQKTIPRWADEFYNADDDRKKVMLRSIIDNVIVYRDKIEINIKFYLQQFIYDIDNDDDGSEGDSLGSAYGNSRENTIPINTTENLIFEEKIVSNF